jgi:hypothetical protein
MKFCKLALFWELDQDVEDSLAGNRKKLRVEAAEGAEGETGVLMVDAEAAAAQVAGHPTMTMRMMMMMILRLVEADADMDMDLTVIGVMDTDPTSMVQLATARTDMDTARTDMDTARTDMDTARTDTARTDTARTDTATAQEVIVATRASMANTVIRNTIKESGEMLKNDPILNTMETE